MITSNFAHLLRYHSYQVVFPTNLNAPLTKQEFKLTSHRAESSKASFVPKTKAEKTLLKTAASTGTTALVTKSTILVKPKGASAFAMVNIKKQLRLGDGPTQGWPNIWNTAMLKLKVPSSSPQRTERTKTQNSISELMRLSTLKDTIAAPEEEWMRITAHTSRRLNGNPSSIDWGNDWGGAREISPSLVLSCPYLDMIWSILFFFPNSQLSFSLS